MQDSLQAPLVPRISDLAGSHWLARAPWTLARRERRPEGRAAGQAVAARPLKRHGCRGRSCRHPA
jgi:hypothetical protein